MIHCTQEEIMQNYTWIHEKYIKIETRDLTTVLPEYKKNVEENIKKIGALTIDDYNMCRLKQVEKAFSII